MSYPPCTEGDVAFFVEHGFLVVEDAIDRSDLDRAAARCQPIVDHKEKLAFDWAWEKGTSRDARAFKIVQGSPTHVWPEIAGTRFREWMIAFGSQLMGRPLEFWYDQFLAKPPREGAPTYWHQDEGYWGRNLDDRGITCWMPLHDVDVRNGCMHFVDGGHRAGVLEHRQPEHIQSDLLFCEPDVSRQVACPIRAGSVTFHHGKTPHMTPAESERRLAPRGHDAHAGGGIPRRRRPLPLEGVRQPVHGRADRARRPQGVAMTRSTLAGPPPAPASFQIEIDDDQVRQFREQGFLAVERITTLEEIAWLESVWDELFADRRRWFDVSQPFGAFDEAHLGQLIFPERYAPVLRETLHFRNARRIAARLLGEPEDGLEAWGHMVLKPARGGHATPWHQDESYWEPDFDYRALGVWLPLEDVSGENGCMCFLPGSHRGELLSHRHVGDDPRVHLLEVDTPIDASPAVEVPLAAGGATFHHHRTLHATAANRSPRLRRAWANEFQTPPRKRPVRAERPWLDAQKRAWAERHGDRA